VKCGRWILCVAFFSAATLVACGSSVTTVQPATVPPAAVPPTPGYPAGGATYSYTTTTWGVVELATPATPVAIPTSSYTQDETVKTGAAFNGRSDLIDVNTVERAQSEVETTDEYLQWVPAARGQALEEVGRTFRSKGQSQGAGQTFYTIPAAEVHVPFSPGTSWNGAAAYHETSAGVEVLAGVPIKSHSDETWNQDGSYSRRDLNIGIISPGQNFRSTDHVASDGSAASSDSNNGGPSVKTRIGVPQGNSSGTYVIPIVDVFGTKANIPDWYPGGALPPSPLVTAIVVDRGMKTLPAGCAVPRSIATTGEAIVRTVSQFDPNGIVGTNTEAAYYAPGAGMVCDVIVERYSDYVILAPAAVLTGNEVFHSTTSLTRLLRKPGAAQMHPFADALSYAAGAALSVSTRRRVHAAVQAALRPYPQR
jgi:hypothetical protein